MPSIDRLAVRFSVPELDRVPVNSSGQAATKKTRLPNVALSKREPPVVVSRHYRIISPTDVHLNGSK